MKNLFLILIAAQLASLGPEALAVTKRDGTRGGGEVMMIDGKPRLRDLVDPSACEDKSGEEVLGENPKVDAVLKKIAKLDWYFAAGLRREIGLLRFCFTDKVVKVQGNDPDSAIVYSEETTEQAAVRYIGTYDVVVNKHYHRAMPLNDQTFFSAHEAIHSFIPMGIPRRNESVRGIINTLEDVASGRIASRRKLHQLMTKYSVQYPLVSNQLAAHRQAIEFALASPSEQKAMILSTRDLNSLFSLNLGEVLEHAYGAHISALQLGAAAHVSSLLDQDDLDFALLDRLVNPPATSPRILDFDPVMVALSIPAVLQSPEYLARVLQSQSLKDGFELYRHLKTKSFRIGHSRILGTDGFAMLGHSAEVPDPRLGDVFALSLAPYSTDAAIPVPTEIKGLLQFIAAQARTGENGWKVIEASVIRNSEFYTAFGTASLEAQLDNLNAPIAREKTQLRTSLPQLVHGFRVLLYSSIRANVDERSAARLDREIDWQRLGLKN